jgi:hypothetical protein
MVAIQVKRLDRVERFVVGVLVYLGLSGVWIYGVLDTGVLEGHGVLGWAAVAVVLSAHVVFGFAIREWVAVLLPIAVVFLAVPSGYPESDFEPPPVWFWQALLTLVEVPLVAIGLGFWAGRERLSGRARSS